MKIALTTLDKKPYQSRPLTQILAVVVVIAPPYAFIIWSQLSQATITLKQIFLYPLLIGGGTVVFALLIYRFICGERITSLNLKPSKWYMDILVGVLLAAVFLGLFMLQQFIQSRYLPVNSDGPPEELVILFTGVANNSLLLVVWLGPVVWLGVALFEELTRVFILNRLWVVWPKPITCWLIMVGSAVLFGMAHFYQGPVSMVAIGIQGFLYALYYRRFGRIGPMIIGHALYDSVQVIQVVMAFRDG